MGRATAVGCSEQRCGDAPGREPRRSASRHARLPYPNGRLSACARQLTLARADLDARQSRDEKLFSLQLKQLTPATAPLPTTAGGLVGLPTAGPATTPAGLAGINPMTLLVVAVGIAALFVVVKQIAK